MNKYRLVQLGCLLSVVMALLLHTAIPDHAIPAAFCVEVILRLLQLVLIPNVFLSLCSAIILLDTQLIKKLLLGFLRMVVSLWMLVVSLLFAFWVFLFDASRAQLLPYQAGEVDLGVAGLLPLVMLSAIIVGYVFIGVESFKPYQRYLSKLQIKVARLFEMVYVLIPGLVFFVVLNFMQYAELGHLIWALNYVGLSLLFVLVFTTGILPLCFRYFLGVRYAEYFTLVSPIALMTFVAGDSLAAIPLIASAANQFGYRSNLQLATILTMVVICFPWLGELANLIFPVYGAAVEGYPVESVLNILAVGPFFMFTDPLISMPSLLQSFGFSEVYQSAYLTMAMFTDHMFEMTESIAVLLVCARLKMLLVQDSDEPTHLEV